MRDQVDSKFTWVIKNFSTLLLDKITSEEFVIGGCKWCLVAYTKGTMQANYFSLYLKVADSVSLPLEWKRHAKISFVIVNQIPGKNSQRKETYHWFNDKDESWGFRSMSPFNELKAKDSGFLVNDELKIVVEIKVLEVIGKTDISMDTSLLNRSIDVNGFQVLPSQAEYVNRLFERHPYIASNLPVKNQYIKTGHMNVLLSLIETLRQPPQKISQDDLAEAYAALGSVTDAGFKLDWLEKKLNEVSKKKVKEEACETRIKELDEELKDLKKKWSDVEALLEKEKAQLLAARAPLSYDDIF